MKAISTKYLGPTDTKGSRIRAFANDVRGVTVPWNYELENEENHRAAAEALLAKMDWSGNLAGGWVKDGMVFVFVGGE
jgi:hypothetical protein